MLFRVELAKKEEKGAIRKESKKEMARKEGRKPKGGRTAFVDPFVSLFCSIHSVCKKGGICGSCCCGGPRPPNPSASFRPSTLAVAKERHVITTFALREGYASHFVGKRARSVMQSTLYGGSTSVKCSFLYWGSEHTPIL